MKTELERIELAEDSSFNLMINPNLSDFFFWHFHPELELVYIEGASGIRNVGEHQSRFHHSDLVFIGSNIPHLNFDYGVKTKYEKRVVHFKPDFLQYGLKTLPELKPVRRLFELANHGVAFGENTKKLVADRIKEIHLVDHFERFIEILKIFHVLGSADDSFLLHDQPVRSFFTRKDQERLRDVYALIESEYHRKIEVAEIAELANLTRESFCRFFKKMTKLTFVEFLNHYRIDVAKKLLLQDKNVTNACFASGFESLSYFNRTFKKVTGENPLAYKKRISTD